MQKQIDAFNWSTQLQGVVCEESKKALDAVADEVNRVYGKEWDDPNRDHLFKLLASIIEPRVFDLAHMLLKTSGNRPCLRVTAELKPLMATDRGNALMRSAERYLATPTDARSAREAYRLLEEARTWYNLAGSIRPEVELRIKQGLDLTEWVHQTV